MYFRSQTGFTFKYKHIGLSKGPWFDVESQLQCEKAFERCYKGVIGLPVCLENSHGVLLERS